jgi:asparagine synthase (glutamine-hydrolysing)
MSAINCCFSHTHSDSKSSDLVIDSALQASNYWQPDAISKASNATNNCTLGKASLFNTANSKNDKVYTNPITGNIISANVRIDNRLDLITKLNIINSSITDGELILTAYQKWGKACVKQLLGDFAFIIWDEKKQKVFCARDHFGIKVLLYSQNEDGILLSNEPNAFFESNWLKKQIKESWLVNQIWNLGPTGVEAAYNGLDVLPPAHTLEFDVNGVNIERYWELEDKKDWDHLSKDELIAEFKKRFSKSVERRTVTDYKLGCQLSEGLDSNGITGYAARLNPNKNIHTFSYQTTELNEETEKVWGKTYEDIQEMIDMHANLKPLWSKDTDVEQENQDLVANIGAAFSINGQFLPHCKLAQKNNVKVLLSGWGGDHCVSSPGDFYESELFTQRKFLKLIQLFRDKNERGRGGKAYRGIARLFVKHFAPNLFTKLNFSKKMGLEPSMIERGQNSLLKQEYIRKYNLKEKLNDFLTNYQARFSTKDYSKRELFEIGLAQRVTDSEFTGRMFKLEYRFPMLDVELVEFAYNLPSYLKVFKGVERYVYREVIKGYTTEGIRLRKKADVNHPNFGDQSQMTETEKNQLFAILEIPHFKNYIDEVDLNSLTFHKRFLLKQINRKAGLFTYFNEHNVPVD